MHFPSVWDFLPISEKFVRLPGKFSQCYLLPKFFSIFIRQNFWWLFLVIDYKFWIPPIFAVSTPDLVKFTTFLHTLCVFVSPLVWPWCIYASRNARTRCPWLTMTSIHTSTTLHWINCHCQFMTMHSNYKDLSTAWFHLLFTLHYILFAKIHLPRNK